MKKILLVFFVVFAANLSAQTVEIPIEGSFDEIKLYNKIEARLLQSDENKIVLEGIAKEDISAKVSNNTLRVKSSLADIFKDDTVSLVIYYTGAKIIDVNEGSILEIRDKIVQKDLMLSAQEGAEIITTVEVNTLKAKLFSGGIISVKGKAESQEISVKAGGQYEGKKLLTKATKVEVSAGGEAEINASETCKAKVTAGGSIYIYGNPSKLEQKTSFGGKIVTKKQ